jgi:hypothetical protein
MNARTANLTPAATLRRPDGVDPVDWLAEDLGGLAAACDATTTAVENHDLAGLVAANELAETLTERIRDRAAGLTEAERARVGTDRIRTLHERISRAVQRNAYLIERAWALDAATMRLLASLGRPHPDLPLHSYGPPDGPGYLDRQA